LYFPATFVNSIVQTDKQKDPFVGLPNLVLNFKMESINIYLEAYHIEIGLLINFGAKSFTNRRLINPNFNPF